MGLLESGNFFRRCSMTLLFAIVALSASLVRAGDLEWSGLYRIEGISIDNSVLDSSSGKKKEYGLHNLILRPKIVAADGLYINGQLNVFNGPDGNQRGAVWGDGVGQPSPGNTDSSSSNSASEAQNESEFRISQFYLTFVQEHGSLIAGRAPLDFGLGITHNAGRGIFDHYADTRDLVGYKFMAGNFYVFPMYAKISEGSLSGYDDVREVNIQLQYENVESDIEMGLFYQNRKASAAGNDMPELPIGGTNPADGQMNGKAFNIYYKKNSENFSAGMEVSQQSGDTGVDGISLSGFGVAAEISYHPVSSKNSWGLKAGYATGDDPTTKSEFEGFIFDRNYDVAMLLFNHPLGGHNLFRTGLIGRDRAGVISVNDEPDIEAISNVYYLAPSVRRKMNDKLSWNFTFVTAYLDTTDFDVDGDSALDADADTNLGYEFDLSLDYQVSDSIQWINQFGYLSAGTAWEVDGNFDADNSYGFVTKAAVSF